MHVQLAKASRTSCPIFLTDAAHFKSHAKALTPNQRDWLEATGFTGAPYTHALLPDASGRIAAVWAGIRSIDDPWALSALPKALPEKSYHLDENGLKLDDGAAALSWELGAYSFNLYKQPKHPPSRLHLPATSTTQRALIIAAAITATRDLINSPAEHLGPAELADAARVLARRHGAKFKEIVGDKLLKAGFPAVHAVGRASVRAPRLIELNWGNPQHPRITLVGKGVCFDTGGLNVKATESMRNMKLDMGGAANALGLAEMIMALQLPLRLQLLIPAVENAVAGNAYRQGDIFKTRSGLHIEIRNTDAEGRVILSDAISYACEFKPDLLIDLATLTGAGRIALGSRIPALFTRDTALARELVDRSLVLDDPIWHLPLWDEYHVDIESDIADIANTGKGPRAGAITAALFLENFVPAGQSWLHIDFGTWNDTERPGRPLGGDAQSVRTLLDYLEKRYAGPHATQPKPSKRQKSQAPRTVAGAR